MSKPSAKMIEAVRVGCVAANIHLTCDWPDCTCTQIPRAVLAVLKFAVPVISREMAEEWKKSARAQV